ncbi:MAG: hypothetical protein II949_00155 [Prevotella sp.]|nr:hypothetical protein [Prevotella sp.]
MNYELIATLLPTILIELVVLWLLGERRPMVLWSSVAVNTLTNIPLNLYVQHVHPSIGVMALAEVGVVIVEAVWYVWFVRNLRQAMVYSLLCNTVSILTGLLVVLVRLL